MDIDRNMKDNQLKIQTEVIEYPPDPALQEESACMQREYEEKEEKARRHEKWRRIFGLGFCSKK